MKKIILLIAIIFVAAFLRFYQLAQNPPFLNWDEVAWGYNAYAIGIDGKDEFGRFLPHDYLESFGDFKPPLYVYLAVMPIKIFGMNAFATRFPSALFGTLTVLVTFFLVQRLFPNAKYRDWYALASAGILAISPWHIMLSRAAFEANVATFLVVTGIWLFLGGLQERKWYIPLSAVPFALSFYTFNTPRIVVPLIVIAFAIFFWRQLLARKKEVIFAVLLGIMLILPTAKFLLSPQASLRFQEVNIFTDTSIIKHINQEVINDNTSQLSKILHNRRAVFTVDFLKHYFDNLNPAFLFISGDPNLKFSTHDVGQLYLWDIPFFIMGIFLLVRKKEGYWWVVPLWLLLGIIPAATAIQTPHALRTEIALPTFQILVGYGLVWTCIFLKEKLKNTYERNAIFSGIFLLLVVSVVYFQHGYYSFYRFSYSGDWNYSYKPSLAYVNAVQSQYSKIVITTDVGRPYIYYLFYMHISPQVFRKEANITRDVFGFVHVNGFGKYIFTSSPPSVKGNNLLYIDNVEKIPPGAHILKQFNNLNNGGIMVAYTL